MAALKERLIEQHKTRRLIYSNQMIRWDLIDWSRVIFIDEFKICSGECGRLYVWREDRTRYEERNLSLVSHNYRFSVSFITWYLSN